MCGSHYFITAYTFLKWREKVTVNKYGARIHTRHPLAPTPGREAVGLFSVDGPHVRSTGSTFGDVVVRSPWAIYSWPPI